MTSGGNLNPANADLGGWTDGITRRCLTPTASCTNDAREPQRIEATTRATQQCLAGSLADQGHNALMGEELMTRSGNVRAEVSPQSRVCSTILAVVVVVISMGRRSRMWRHGAVHQMVLTRGG